MRSRRFMIAGMAALAVISTVGLLEAAPGVVRGVRPGSESVVIDAGETVITVTPYSEKVIRVLTMPAGSSERYVPTQGIVAVPDVRYRVSSEPDRVVVATDSASVAVDRATGRLSFHDASGRELLSSAPGANTNTPLERSLSMAPATVGNLYGAGERGHSLRLNGDTLSMYNRQNYGYGEGDPRISQMGISVPYVASDAGYAILFDDFSKGQLLLADTITYTSQSPAPAAAYLISAPTLADATDALTALSGRQPLPPFWTLGYITSKYGYHNRAEAEGVIDTLKKHGYPVDGMVLDLYWYGVETDMGRLAWDSVQWPDHEAMLTGLRDRGVNVVAISQPYINKKGAIDNYNELVERGMTVRDHKGGNHDVTIWVGESGMFDVSNPDTRRWLWNRLRPLTAGGIAGWWGDLGEPEVHPQSVMHHNGLSAEQYHNVYGNEWSRLIYDGLRADFPDRRPLLMMRGGTTGLQRYGVFPWTTDVARSWAGLQPQVKLMLSSGLSGLGYMGSDIGGFAVDPASPTDPELYVRWLQMGAFSPMLRTHAQLKPEPYHYPRYEDISRRFIRMRYEWLPYNYTLAYDNATTGAPLARPLNFRSGSGDDRLASVPDEYLWGDNVLVAPVMKAGARVRRVVFPAGRWIDWYNPRLSYAGGSTATVKAPLDRLPLFVKAGSFIPQYMEPIANVTQYDPRFLTVKYFAAADTTSYTLFEDNRLSPTSLQDNEYVLLRFTGSRVKGVTTVEIRSEGSYTGMPDARLLTLQVVGLDRAPRALDLSDGTELREAVSLKAIRQYGYTYDAATRTLSVRFPYAGGEPLVLTAR